MTKKQAKKITLEVWTYLRDHPEILVKMDLPKKIYDKIKELQAKCALCEIFHRYEIGYSKLCYGCPLHLRKEHGQCTLWARWDHAKSNKGEENKRKQAAAEIVRRVKAWKV